MANREVLLGIVIAVASLGCSRPRDRYLIPDGYAGWLCISYGVSGAPGLPMEDDFRLVVFPPSGIVETSSPGLSLPRFRGHPNSHESAIGGCHGKAEAEEAAIVLAGVQGGDGPVGAGEREEPRDDRPGARSHRDSAARLGAAG